MWIVQGSETVGTWDEDTRRVLERRLRERINIDPMQFGFMPGKGTVNANFVVRQLQEKFMEKKRVVLCIC